jgi:hypothetical protein
MPEKVFSVLHHSPIDLLALLPVGLSVSSRVEDEVDVLLTDNYPKLEKTRAKNVFVFSGFRKDGYIVLDETKDGRHKPLTTSVVDQALNFKEKKVVLKKPSQKPKKKVKKPVKKGK